MPELPDLPSIIARQLPNLIVCVVFLYASIALLVTTFRLITRLRRVRSRLSGVVTGDQLVAVFADTHLGPLRSRILDLAPSEWPLQRDRILLDTPVNFSRARREITHVYRDRLLRVQFFTALALLLTTVTLGWIQEYAQISVFGITLALGLASMTVVTLGFFAILGRLAIDHVVEPLLDSISALPLGRLELTLLRDIRAAGDRFAVSSASAFALPPVDAASPILERLAHSLEQDRHSLRQFTTQLFETAETLNVTAKAVSESSVDAVHTESYSGRAQELKTAIDRLTLTINHLAGMVERIPATASADTNSKPPARLNGELREELRALLKDFE